MAAMRVGARDSDAYLAEWVKRGPVEVGDDIEAEADKALQAIEADYPKERLVALVKSDGFDT